MRDARLVESGPEDLPREMYPAVRLMRSAIANVEMRASEFFTCEIVPRIAGAELSYAGTYASQFHQTLMAMAEYVGERVGRRTDLAEAMELFARGNDHLAGLNQSVALPCEWRRVLERMERLYADWAAEFNSR